jgi:hemolysin activation/secretion protein
LYLGYQSAESSDIQKSNNSSIRDFSNSFVTGNFEFLKLDKSNFLFPEKTKLSSKIGYGSRFSNSTNYQQFFANIDISHTLYLNLKNSIYLKSRNYYLQSDQYIVNELYRFGGINSIRGFNENSLQGNFFTSLLSEYRYLVSHDLYVHSIIDYGFYSDATISKNENLFGFGFGFGLLTKNGLLNMVYANGSSGNQNIQLSNSVVHLSLKLNLF